MNESEPFLRAIVERPDDDFPRLVYADWLDENHETEWAQLIRIQCARSKSRLPIRLLLKLKKDHLSDDDYRTALEHMNPHMDAWGMDGKVDPNGFGFHFKTHFAEIERGFPECLIMFHGDRVGRPTDAMRKYPLAALDVSVAFPSDARIVRRVLEKGREKIQRLSIGCFTDTEIPITDLLGTQLQELDLHREYPNQIRQIHAHPSIERLAIDLYRINMYRRDVQGLIAHLPDAFPKLKFLRLDNTTSENANELMRSRIPNHVVFDMGSIRINRYQQENLEEEISNNQRQGRVFYEPELWAPSISGNIVYDY